MYIPSNLPTLPTFVRNLVFKTRLELTSWLEYIQERFNFNVFRYNVFNADNQSIGVVLTYNF